MKIFVSGCIVLNFMSRKFIRKYENGQVRSSTTTLNGVLEGEVKYWHKNGQVDEERYFRNGNENGEFKSWFESGRIHQRRFYKDGKLEGGLKEWFSTGILWRQAIFRAGECICRNYGCADSLSKLKGGLYARLTRKRNITLHDFLIPDLADSFSVYRKSNCRA
jgi:hypothetical protein